jgi:hypothetical protein
MKREQDSTPNNMTPETSAAIARRAAVFGLGAFGAAMAAACNNESSAGSRVGRVKQELASNTDYADSVADLVSSVDPSQYKVIILLGYYSPLDGGGGTMYWDDGCTMTADNGMVFDSTFSGAPAGKWRRVCDDGVVSVKYFGAWGSEAEASPTTNRLAIQAAIDFVADAGWPAGVVYFPANMWLTTLAPRPASVYAIDQPIVLPRVYNYGYDTQIILRGDARDASFISADFGTDLFITDTTSTNTNGARYVFENLGLSTREGARALNWDPGVAGAALHLDVFNVKVLAGQGETDADGVFYINGLDRGTFRQVDVQFSGGSGAAIAFNIVGKATFHNCRTLLRGALIKFYGVELVMVNCRTEGAIGIPSWRFYTPTGTTWSYYCGNITIINPCNEGATEYPALMHFSNCRNVVLINPQLATPDHTYNGVGADGIRFDEACEACQVISPTTPAAYSQGPTNSAAVSPETTPRTAKAIYATPDTTYITVTGASTSGAFLPENEYLLTGKDSYVEATYSLSTVSTRVAGTKLTQVTQIREVASVGTPPTDAGFLYIDSSDGKLKFKGRSGTVTDIANP